jgi:hypothetical protein
MAEGAFEDAVDEAVFGKAVNEADLVDSRAYPVDG